MNKKLVSILIPAYNAEKWIEKTITSAIEQTWPYKEVIVIDDGSRDQTYYKAKQFQKNGVKIFSQENLLVEAGLLRNR